MSRGFSLLIYSISEWWPLISSTLAPLRTVVNMSNFGVGKDMLFEAQKLPKLSKFNIHMM